MVYFIMQRAKILVNESLIEMKGVQILLGLFCCFIFSCKVKYFVNLEVQIERDSERERERERDR